MKLILLLTYLFVNDSTNVKPTANYDAIAENFYEWISLQEEIKDSFENYFLEIVDLQGNSLKKSQIHQNYDIHELERTYKADHLMTVGDHIYLLSK